MTFTIAIQSHNFNHRLCWMLSSLISQTQHPRLFIKIDLSYLENSGVEQICKYFASAIPITQRRYYKIEDLQYRGYTRTQAILDCDTQWLLFADSDHVYHPEWFLKLRSFIRRKGMLNYAGIMTAGRVSCLADTANTLIAKYNYPSFIESSFEQIFKVSERFKRGSKGAGHTQLINIDYCDHDGYYVADGESKDRSWTKSVQKAKSDVQFRRRIGQVRKIPKWFSRNQYHLNHARDNEVGKHLEIMR